MTGRVAIINAIGSDIGAALAERWLARGDRVLGSARTRSPRTARLEAQGARIYPCDLERPAEIDACCAQLLEVGEGWDVLVLGAGSTEPIGPFAELDFDDWTRSIQVNFTNQLRFVHRLLPARRHGGGEGPCVLFFAGGGSNSAPVNYSAYTVSKVALIKMCELLDAEMPGVRFAILGPGWVRTRIHDETIRAGERAGANYRRTLEKLAADEFTPMAEVLDCCDWLVAAPARVIGGRNFSLARDAWGSPELAQALAADSGLYKLRRSGNDLGLARERGKKSP